MIFLLLGLMACMSEQGTIPISCTDAAPLEWNHCRSCHSLDSPDRYDAPEEINFDSEEDVESLAALIYDSVLVQENMPKGGGVDPEELRRLEGYLRCWMKVEP
jgi:uncharacterized membrane protein